MRDCSLVRFKLCACIVLGHLHPHAAVLCVCVIFYRLSVHVFFVSAQVLPTFADRHAITLWYYDQTEREQAVKKAREEGTASKVATASTESQQLAKVGGDGMGGDGSACMGAFL